jgi:NUBPL iron-transfer P-loop NTPase
MAKKIIMVCGGKGGVGKSMVTMATLDRLADGGSKVTLVETDTSNPDVHKCYGSEVPAHLVDLEAANGWVELLNLCDAEREATVVVNTRAANNEGVRAYGETLRGALSDLERSLATFWVINAQRDSVELLKAFLETMPEGELHVVRNMYFGREEEFEAYNGSKTRGRVEERGGRSLTFPVLASRVANDLYNKRLSIGRAFRDLPIGQRAELRRWKNLVSQSLGQVVA